MGWLKSFLKWKAPFRNRHININQSKDLPVINLCTIFTHVCSSAHTLVESCVICTALHQYEQPARHPPPLVIPPLPWRIYWTTSKSMTRPYDVPHLPVCLNTLWSLHTLNAKCNDNIELSYLYDCDNHKML